MGREILFDEVLKEGKLNINNSISIGLEKSFDFDVEPIIEFGLPHSLVGAFEVDGINHQCIIIFKDDKMKIIKLTETHNG